MEAGLRQLTKACVWIALVLQVGCSQQSMFMSAETDKKEGGDNRSELADATPASSEEQEFGKVSLPVAVAGVNLVCSAVLPTENGPAIYCSVDESLRGEWQSLAVHLEINGEIIPLMPVACESNACDFRLPLPSDLSSLSVDAQGTVIAEKQDGERLNAPLAILPSIYQTIETQTSSNGILFTQLDSNDQLLQAEKAVDTVVIPESGTIEMQCRDVEFATASVDNDRGEGQTFALFAVHEAKPGIVAVLFRWQVVGSTTQWRFHCNGTKKVLFRKSP